MQDKIICLVLLTSITLLARRRGLASRMEIMLSEIVSAGITTAVGVLGFDSITEALKDSWKGEALKKRD